ncbi:MAG: SMP-30/gluconolactonase/LRE family protein [Spirochaetia bacterium]
MKPVRHCIPSQNNCGESPMWDPRQSRLYWVDTEKPTLSSYTPASGAKSVAECDWLVQCIGPRKSGGWVAVVRDGFALLEKDRGKGKFLGNPIEGKPELTMNDGAVGPDGRFYAGSLNKDVLEAPAGALHRLDPDGTIHTIETGLVLPNGISFSPDGKTMYVTEMWARRITAFNFDARKGTVSRRRVLITLPEEEGYPDGLIVDAEGFLWSAHWQGFRVTRYDPDGRKERIIEVPVPTATCMVFGGKALDTLYITTGKKGLTPEQLQKFPQAGDVFAVEPGITGRLEPEFAG